jgi:hypothetical protein
MTKMKLLSHPGLGPSLLNLDKTQEGKQLDWYANAKRDPDQIIEQRDKSKDRDKVRQRQKQSQAKIERQNKDQYTLNKQRQIGSKQ